MHRTSAILLAAGSGVRFGGRWPKQFAPLGGKPLLAHAVDRFVASPDIETIVVVTHPLHLERTRALFEGDGYRKVEMILGGGETRQISAYLGLQALPDPVDRVVIHDAARPLLTLDMIHAVVATLDRWRAATLAAPSTDTIVEVDREERVVTVPPRSFLRRVQTPQAFHRQVIEDAHRMALEQGVDDASDDCGLVHRFRLAEVMAVPARGVNMKITCAEDLVLAEQILATRRPGENNG